MTTPAWVTLSKTIVLQLVIHTFMDTECTPLLRKERMQENRVTPKEFDIVVTGIGGSGKTAVINLITGSASEVDHSIGHVEELTPTKSTLESYDVVLLETKCILTASRADIKCPKPSVLILCVNIMDTRLGHSHVQALAKVSRYFNKRVWNNCIIALTFADLLPTKPDFDTHFMKEELEKEVENWKSYISMTLASNNVPQEVIQKVRFVPIACKKEISKNPEVIDEQESLDALKSACISVLDARKSLPDKNYWECFCLLAGALLGCVGGIVFPPLICLTVPCGVLIGQKVHKFFI